jgi:hypothetical protein
MSEPTDLPPGDAVTARPAGAPAGRDAAAPPPGRGAEGYRPLSGLAVAGFALAALYALVVAGGALLSLGGALPLLMPTWTAVVPLAAAALCAAARRQVAASEGTLAGGALAGWGLGLALAFGLTYWAYYAATLTALRSQASDFTLRWLQDVSAGRLESAYIKTLPPANRPATTDPAKLRQVLEITYNEPPKPNLPGPFTDFCRVTYVRLMHQGGPQAAFTRLSAGAPEVDRGGGLRVPLVYHVATPDTAFDLQVTVLGTEGAAGRQWHVSRRPEETAPRTGSQAPTPQGQEVIALETAARRLAYGWVAKLGRQDLDGACRDTLPEDRRRGPVPPEERKKFEEGGVVRADPKTFWVAADDQHSAEERRAAIEAAVRKDFRPGEAPSGWLTLPDVTPLYERGGGSIRFFVDAQFVPNKDYVVGGQVVVVGDLKNPQKPAWRVEALELLRGRNAPTRRPAL